MEASLEGQRRLDEYIAQQGAESRQRRGADAALEQRFAESEQVVAQGVLDLACELARQVVRRELAQDPEALRPVIREALGLLSADARMAVVRLNPQDHALLAETPAGEFGSLELKWVADPTVAAAAAWLRRLAQVDGSLSRRWARALAIWAWAALGRRGGGRRCRLNTRARPAGQASWPTCASAGRGTALESRGTLTRLTGLVLEASGMRVPVGAVLDHARMRRRCWPRWSAFRASAPF
jgi:hypothetical protein